MHVSSLSLTHTVTDASRSPKQAGLGKGSEVAEERWGKKGSRISLLVSMQWEQVPALASLPGSWPQSLCVHLMKCSSTQDPRFLGSGVDVAGSWGHCQKNVQEAGDYLSSCPPHNWGILWCRSSNMGSAVLSKCGVNCL